MPTKPKPREPGEAIDPAYGKRISDLMDAADLSPQKLSKRLKVSLATAYSWRYGTRRPSREIQPRLARILNTTVAELNGWAA